MYLNIEALHCYCVIWVLHNYMGDAADDPKLFNEFVYF